MTRVKIAFLISSILILFTACSSKPITTESLAEITEIVSDITIGVQLIPEVQLIEMYGRKANVFANYPGMIPAKKLVVFRIDISADSSTIDFDISDFSLTVGGVTGLSKSRSQLLRAWSFYLKKENKELEAKKVVKKRMFQNSTTVNPENPASRWIVFLEKYPDNGEANLSISLTNRDGDVYVVDFPLEFHSETAKFKLF